jgi:hypothetical protein
LLTLNLAELYGHLADIILVSGEMGFPEDFPATGDSASAKAAVSVRILRQILLVTTLGQDDGLYVNIAGAGNGFFAAHVRKN